MAVAPLVTVVVRVVPLRRKTSVLLPVHTVVPVLELEEHEFGMLPVTTVVGAAPVPRPPLVSIGTTLTAAEPKPQLPCGAYTLALVPWTSTPRELDGKHAFGAGVGVEVGVDVEVGVGECERWVVPPEQDAHGSHPDMLSDTPATATNRHTASPAHRDVIVDLPTR